MQVSILHRRVVAYSNEESIDKSIKCDVTRKSFHKGGDEDGGAESNNSNNTDDSVGSFIECHVRDGDSNTNHDHG